MTLIPFSIVLDLEYVLADTVVTTIPVGSYPSSIAYNPANKNMYVTNAALNTVSVIDSSSNNIISTISVGSEPTGIAYNPVNDNMYVTNGSFNIVSVIPATTFQ